MFKKYQHIERFGSIETEGINFGECYVFPKIDGTNAQLWLENDTIFAGSRNRILSLDNDNANFYNYVHNEQRFLAFFLDNPYLRLYGEWLVPHTLKTYRKDAWNKFYVFDVSVNSGEDEEYLSYSSYLPILDKYGIDLIPPICVIKNPTYEDLVKKLDSNIFLIEDGKGFGEGIVIKNYEYRNKYGRQIWAKVVRGEFKEKHISAMGCPQANGSKMIEEEIVNEFLTKPMVEKIKAKIETEMGGWSSKFIPRLLQTSFYDLVKEEMWGILKSKKYPTINFKTLNYFTINKVKEHVPELF